MAKQKILTNARYAKKDEFYTQYKDIENECEHYVNFFEDKTIYCNCDNPYKSNFFKYFVLNFNRFKLKRLIVTCYDDTPPLWGSLFTDDETNKAVKADINYVPDNVDKYNDNKEIIEYLLQDDRNSLVELRGNGDFRSPECIELLKQSDIVVTNPPFSLLRDLMLLCFQNNTEFLLIGNINAIAYSKLFPYTKDNKIQIGFTPKNGKMEFKVTDDYPLYGTGCRVAENGEKFITVPSIKWLTSIPIEKEIEFLELTERYSKDKYPFYDGQDIIEVANVVDIPYDYDGIMGVPISFLTKYNPEQFELLGEANHGRDNEFDWFTPKINGQEVFKRLLIRKRK